MKKHKQPLINGPERVAAEYKRQLIKAIKLVIETNKQLCIVIQQQQQQQQQQT